LKELGVHACPKPNVDEWKGKSPMLKKIVEFLSLQWLWDHR
jgi:hypothetical protein